MADFNQSFQKVMASEGGYVHDPDDPGGETYKGVARKMNPSWSGWKIVDRRERWFCRHHWRNRLPPNTWRNNFHMDNLIVSSNPDRDLYALADRDAYPNPAV